MWSLSEIEAKLAALKKRYVELDEKLVSGRKGVIDGSVSSAMGHVTKEIHRLEALRQDTLVGDLIEREAPVEKRFPPRRSAALPQPIYATPDSTATNPLLDADHLPEDDQGRNEMFSNLLNWCCENANESMRRHHEAAGQNIPVQFTQSLFQALIMQLGFLQAEARWGLALGRDFRNNVGAKLLARIEALESRPQLQYQGVWNAETKYCEGAFTTDGGSLFHANRVTVGERPGSASDAWTLAAKRGRDGRDAKDSK